MLEGRVWRKDGLGWVNKRKPEAQESRVSSVVEICSGRPMDRWDGPGWLAREPQPSAQCPHNNKAIRHSKASKQGGDFDVALPC